MNFFGLTAADNWVLTPDDTDAEGHPVYTRQSGYGFFIVVEARAGTSGLLPKPIFSNSSTSDPTARPDIQMEANQALGNGSLAICDVGPLPTPLGGVPGINPPSFDPTSQFIANALNDLGCRFADNTTAPCTIIDASGINKLVMANSRAQYCTNTVVGSELAFPPGDTLLTVQLRDYPAGNIGYPVSFVVRVPTPAPTGTPTETIPPTLTPTITLTRTPSMTRTVTATPTITSTPLPSPTQTNTPQPTLTATFTATLVPTATRTLTPTFTPTLVPTATTTPTPSATATAVPSASPTSTSSPSPTPSATTVPSETPTATSMPSATETETPAVADTATATETPGS